MLVRHHAKGWKIISHYTHALFAGKIGNNLMKELLARNWPETLTAIINHDDYMVDFDGTDYLTEVGTPRDFMMEGGSDKDAVKHAKALYKETLQKSQWICLLVSRHIEFLYQDLDDAEMRTFLEEMYEKRKEQRRLYGINLDIENHLYSILQFCDRLSLIICGEEVPETGRRLEINTSINSETYYISALNDGKYVIEPWIFSDDKFDIVYEYKILEQTNFRSNKELNDCIATSAVQIQKVTFCKK